MIAVDWFSKKWTRLAKPARKPLLTVNVIKALINRICIITTCVDIHLTNIKYKYKVVQILKTWKVSPPSKLFPLKKWRPKKKKKRKGNENLVNIEFLCLRRALPKTFFLFLKVWRFEKKTNKQTFSKIKLAGIKTVWKKVPGSSSRGTDSRALVL